MNHSYILCIETSTSICSVALCRDAELLRVMERNESGIHASALHPMIQELMHAENLSFAELAAVAVSSGPGSYTGLRIGLSAAKGLCLALNIPLISVNSLEAMAKVMLQAYPGYQAYFPMTDARRMEVYTLHMNADGHVVKPSFAMVAAETESDFWTSLGRVCLAGDGALKMQSFYNIPELEVKHDIQPSAAHLCQSAHEKLMQMAFEDLVTIEPLYVKEVHTTIPKKLI